MNRLSFISILFLTVFIGISCSAPQNVSKENTSTSKEAEISTYPSWYGSESMVSADSSFYGYATAVNADSADAAENAEQWARKELERGLSDKLENVRSEAIKENDADRGLNDAKFLLALREADNGLAQNADVSNVEVRSVEGFSSYRGFAEIAISKASIIAKLDKKMADYEDAWQALKNSKAFHNF